ncbi:MAG TPA: tRNA pseudouridine(55) synthase TruB [Chloroflexota bacterium]|nr:tRNA pseudouridine(55) synthase TruB [Chloroflexota bacterium]
MNGILAVDKPKGWTSHDVVARVRRWSGQRRVGHAGTLDPMATGVLLVVLGEATRMSDDLMHGVKWYLARIRFGIRTDTDDAMGQAIERRAPRFQLADLQNALRPMAGSIQQVPPAFAAIKQHGRPAYKAARAGEKIELAPRSVTVHSIAVLATSHRPEGALEDDSAIQSADLLISCSKGTYIRSIARDTGAALGCGGHLSGLRRLASGAITMLDCVPASILEEAVATGGPLDLEPRLLPLDFAVAPVPACVVGSNLEALIRTGRRLFVPTAPSVANLRVYGPSGDLAAMVTSVEGQAYHPHRVFASRGAA